MTKPFSSLANPLKSGILAFWHFVARARGRLVAYRGGDTPMTKCQNDTNNNNNNLDRGFVTYTGVSSQPISDPIIEMVKADLDECAIRGQATYGTTLADNPLTALEWAEHAYEESRDQALYLKRLVVALREAGR